MRQHPFWLCCSARGHVDLSLARFPAGRFGLRRFCSTATFEIAGQFAWSLKGNIVLKHELWLAMLFRLLPLGPIVWAFLLALVLGRLAGIKGKLRWNTSLIITTIGIAALPLLVWMQTWFAAGLAQLSGQTYLPKPFVSRILPWLACFWPVLLIPFLQWRRDEYRQRAA